ncbi:MAG: ABC transporter substrate-binding protein [Firmicutes bacterium]|nr:ABC transporter substrate-binding protein [Bacillota bacterium]
MWHGAVMAAEEINKAGGVTVGNQKRPIQLVRVDSNEILSVPDAASAVERAITRERVDFLIGGLRTEAVQAMQDVMAEHRRVFLGVGASHPVLTDRVLAEPDKFKYFFRVSPFSAVHLGRVIFMQLTEVANAVRSELGVARPRVAIVGERAVWVDHIVAAAERQIPAMGMELAGVWRPGATATDMTSELSAIRDARAHIIITLFTGPVGTVFARQWEELQVPAAVTGINVDAQGGRFWQATGGRGNFSATMATLGRVPITPMTIPFYDKFMRRHPGEVPLYTASGTYDSVYILDDAIRRAGTISADAVVEALKKTDFAGTAGQVVFNKAHDVTFGPGYVMSVGLQWRDGRPQVFWPAGGGGGVVRYALPPWVVAHWKR